MCPIAIAAVLDPSIEVILYVCKMYLVTLYFVCYFKTMRLTIVELVCFTLSVLISVYYFLFPRSFDELLLLQGRMSGIYEPNFTSLSLIISLCGAFGVYELVRKWRVKMTAIVVAFVCFLGVVLTVSRAGFIGATIALCLFLVIEKRRWYAGVAVAALIIALYSGGALQYISPVFDRFQSPTGRYDLLETIFFERPFMEYAWNTVQNGKWFIGGGPSRVGAWGARFFMVPHNSLLDIGVAFGKASFYFYAALLVALLFVNVLLVLANWRCRNNEEKTKLLTPMLFLSLLPMYMSLSSGLTMSFVLWMVLGAYPLLHLSSNLAQVLSKKSICRYVKL